MKVNDEVIAWVIYKNPKDMPGTEYVARKWKIDSFKLTATNDLLVKSLDELKHHFKKEKFVSVGRHEKDDPCVVEMWL